MYFGFLDLLRLSCESLGNCCNIVICDIMNKIFCEGKNKFKCCCNCCYNYCKYDQDKYKKVNEHFCYCYKEKRKHKWISDYISSEAQKEIIPYLLEYLLSRLLTIGFEKKYKFIEFISLSDEDIKDFDKEFKPFSKGEHFIKIVNKNFTIGKMIIPIISYFLYLTSSIYFGNFFIKKKITDFRPFNAISNILLYGIHGILLVNSIISFSFSLFYLFHHEEKIGNYILIPVLLSNFYFFSFNYYCASVNEEKKGYEFIMTPSALMSLYLLIWNFFQDKVVLKFIKNDYSLYIIKTVIYALVLILFLFYFLSKCCSLFDSINCDPCKLCDSCGPFYMCCPKCCKDSEKNNNLLENK